MCNNSQPFNGFMFPVLSENLTPNPNLTGGSIPQYRSAEEQTNNRNIGEMSSTSSREFPMRPVEFCSESGSSSESSNVTPGIDFSQETQSPMSLPNMSIEPVQAGNYMEHSVPAPAPNHNHDMGGELGLLDLDIVDPIGYTDRDQVSDTMCGAESLGFPGLYSTTGFDMITILSKIANRRNPQINIGPVDMSCAFVVSDARQYDFPIVYATQSFERLTGYQYHETIGRNCRFLQSPDGQVTLGSRRRHTDNTTVFNMKNCILQGKEIQVSMVNYKKGGQPFVNLLTIIPISMHGDEITHYVGFQVDLVEQPHEILGKIRDGTYMENFTSASNSINTIISSGILQKPLQELNQSMICSKTTEFPISSEVYKILGVPESVDHDVAMRMWNNMLLEESDDFVHVLSLKGIFLYCSPSCEDILGYRPAELVGTPLSDICEPSDLVPVLRELKEASQDTISMIYRIKRKNSEYMWFEAQGQLHLDKSKSRKYAILTGRARPVYKLSREIIETCGGFNDKEFWCKLYLDGMILFATSSCQNILGHAPSELEGTSLYQLVRSDRTTALTRAFQQAEQGITVKLTHNIQNKRGQYINVISTFYPGNTSLDGKPSFILSQTREHDCSDENSDSSNDSSAPSPQTNKVSTNEDNVFSLLNLNHKTNWQYELHQLKMANRALREELDTLVNSNKRRRKRSAPTNNCCTMCQRRDSPEWRRGPLGPRTLCNSCGLKYAKTLHANKVE